MFGHTSQISFLTILATMVLVLYTTGSCSDEALGPMGDPEISAIYGGECANKNEFPFMVFVRLESKSSVNKQSFSCGGSIISDQWIITAAHCFEGMTYDDVVVFIGAHDLRIADEKGRTYHAASHIFPHPNYTVRANLSDLHDIGLIKLKEPLNFMRDHRHIKPIELAGKEDAGSFPPGTACLLIGWGDMEYNPRECKKHQVLQKLITIIKNLKGCEAAVGGASMDGSLCSMSFDGYALSGDSGGPLLCPKEARDGKDVLAGVLISGSIFSGSMAHTSISSHIDWIKDVTKLKLP